MLSQETINTVNQLPPSAQKMVGDLIDLLSFKHLDKTTEKTSVSVKVTDNTKDQYDKAIEFRTLLSNVEGGFFAYVNAPERQETLDDTFGIIKTNRKVTLEDMQHAIETMGGELDSY